VICAGTRIEKIVGCATCHLWLIELAICFGHALQNGKKFNANFSPNDMAIKKNNHPAFPVSYFSGDSKTSAVKPNSGMAIRDYFAASALRGYRASEEFSGELPEIVAELSFVDADAMMIEREKNTFNQ
jgi:hypothetical protein